MSEGGMIKLSPSLLAGLAKGGMTIHVLEKDHLALETVVAGTSFRKLDQIEPLLEKQVKLDLKREGKNEYDQFAVSLSFDKHKIGYIPKTKNETIARLMDAGKHFYATLEAKEWEGNWLRLEIKVYLKD
jgi:hypothetical protein